MLTVARGCAALILDGDEDLGAARRGKAREPGPAPQRITAAAAAAAAAAAHDSVLMRGTERASALRRRADREAPHKGFADDGADERQDGWRQNDRETVARDLDVLLRAVRRVKDGDGKLAGVQDWRRQDCIDAAHTRARLARRRMMVVCVMRQCQGCHAHFGVHIRHSEVLGRRPPRAAQGEAAARRRGAHRQAQSRRRLRSAGMRSGAASCNR